MLGSLISAGANLIGGLIGRKSAADANKENIEQQREFAQSGVQWRVEDARKAGVSPLVALGMSPVSFSPSSVGDTSLPSALSSMGQDVSRAVSATSTSQQRMDGQVQALTLTRMGLENDLLAAQIAKTKQQIGPPFPGGASIIPGAGDAPELVVRTFKDPTGKDWRIAATQDAQDWENRYGEIGGELFGLGNMAADLELNARDWWRKQYQPRDGSTYPRRSGGGAGW